MWKSFKQWIPSILIAVCLSLFIKAYVAEAMSVPTGSMIPTIEKKDHLIVEKMMWLTSLQNGDIVVFHSPVAEERYVKRLIGLPGDRIEVKNGKLYRNDAPVDEPYIQEKMNYSYGPITVPQDYYFFLGDNRNNSYDSHLWAKPFVKKDEIIGKVLAIVPTHVFSK
ncbi:signal peptidase I [Paenibacillus alvei]|uniref:signal peptidase I n=1 Tax=Paenibacillus alvei TaxID=44250 RepID=UPI0018CF1685|nr:signal peptidase I [Paenibacillus alvei]MBG9735469.1 signal peptidase [Paenibacillus alvei]MBG9746801.1 signal peptidase [Paenibacillus alvei]MCY9578594.1 signal peptidase I [Paenibacillus alvei]MCY9584914.1 signal peptidase I [Paenibacillus alvei]